MTYDPSIAWAVLTANTPTSGRTEREAWRYILDATESYPTGVYQPPLKAPRYSEKPKPIGGLRWEYETPGDPTSAPVALSIACGSESGRLVFTGDPAADTAALADVLLMPALKSALLASWEWSAGGANGFLHYFARAFTRIGWTIDPIASGSICKALILRHKRRAIWLTDAQEMIGGQALTLDQFTDEYAPRSVNAAGSAQRLAEALGAYQRQTLGMFGVALHATIGAAALRAASCYVPDDKWVWRPNPLMVAMNRTAHGFRGGYSYAQAYDGPAYQADISKAYTSALVGDIPHRSALVPAGLRWQGEPGIYLCRVSGFGKLPIYIAPWRGKAEGFTPEYWSGGRALAVLSSTEYPGIRALGYTIEQLGGYVHISTWTLAPFAQRIAEICAAHGRGSAHERTAKVIGNAVYGKFAQRPDHDDVRYSAASPGAEWFPMIDQRGNEVPDLWTSQTITHRPGQHVDIAATITGRVRSWLYTALADTLDAGGQIVHADTDGFLSTIDPSAQLDTTADKLGAWRVGAQPDRAIVWGRKAYAFGDEVRAAGFSGLTQADGAVIAAGGTVETYYMATPAPWKSGAGVVLTKRLARATA